MRKLFILIALSVLLISCTPSNTDNDNEEGLSIVTTSFVTYDFTKVIAPYENVTLLIKPGQNAHSFEPTAQDMVAIEGSDLLVYTNDGMEPWVNGLIGDHILKLDASMNITYLESDHDHSHDHEHRHDHDNSFDELPTTTTVEGLKDHYHTGDELVLDASDNTHADFDHWHWFTRHDDHEDWQAVPDAFTSHLHYTVPEESFEIMAVLYDNDHTAVSRSEILTVVIDNHDDDHAHGHDHHHGPNDPHTWTSMKNAIIMVETIRDALIELNPDSTTSYEENAQTLISELKQLDTDYASAFGQATIEPLVFLGHFGLNYLMYDYDFEYIALFESMSHETEPTISQMSLIIDTINEHALEYVFVEELSQLKLINTIEEETGVKTLILHSSHNVSQQEFDDGLSFIQIQKQNIENLKIGLNNE